MPGFSSAGSVPPGQAYQQADEEQIFAPFVAVEATVYQADLTPGLLRPETADVEAVVHVGSVETPGGSVRSSQVPAEVVISPSAPVARVSQVASEVVVQPTTAQARTSQLAAEVVIQILDPDLLLSQMAVEVVMRNTSEWVHVSVID